MGGGTKERKLVQNKNDTPGPGTYSNEQSMLKNFHKGAVFGSEKRDASGMRSKSKSDMPGPG